MPTVLMPLVSELETGNQPGSHPCYRGRKDGLNLGVLGLPG